MTEPDSDWTFEGRCVLFGFLVGIGLHVCQVIFFPFAGSGGLAVIGVSQLLYVIPAIIIVARKKQKDWLIGLLIAAGATFIANAVCFGLVMSSF